MVFSFLISMPLFVSLFWLIYLVVALLQDRLYQWSKPCEPHLTAITLFFMAATLLYACHFMYFAGYGSKVLESVYATCNLLVYPLFYLYLLKLTSPRPAKNVYHLYSVSQMILLFSPALIVLIAYSVCFAFGYENVRQGFYLFARACFAVQVVTVWILGSRMLRTYRDRLDDYYSDDRSYRLLPLTILLHLFGIIAIISAILNLIGREWFAGRTIIALPALLMSVLLYALGYVVNKLGEIGIAEEPDDSSEDERTELPQNASKEASESSRKASLPQQLEQLMLSEKPYLRPNLTLQDLALMLGTNRTYLSDIMRTEIGMSFSLYINSHRIEHAKHILADKTIATNKEAILAAQTESGFASESRFYHLFKQHTGMTPLQWRLKAIA